MLSEQFLSLNITHLQMNSHKNYDVDYNADEAADDAKMEDKLRIATININKSIRHLPLLLNHANDIHLHMVAVSEMGDPVGLEQTLNAYGWNMVLNGDDKSGTALLIRSSLEPFVRKKFVDGERGRLVGLMLELPSGVKVVVLAVYIPTGRDFDTDNESAAAKLTSEVYTRLMRWTTEGDICVVAGDFNETLSPLDSSNTSRKKLNARGSWLESWSREYVDCFRTLHGDGGFTFTSWTHQHPYQSRIDYIFAKSNTQEGGEVEVLSCEVATTQSTWWT